MSVPSSQFAFQGAVSPGGDWPPIVGVPLEEPSASSSSSATKLSYQEVFLTTDDSASNTISDIGGMSLTLAKGTWLILVNVSVFATSAPTAGDSYTLCLTDASDTIVAETSVSWQETTGSDLWASLSLSKVVVVTALTLAYKLRHICNTGGDFIAEDGSFRDTTSDLGSSMRAIKIA